LRKIRVLWNPETETGVRKPREEGKTGRDRSKMVDGKGRTSTERNGDGEINKQKGKRRKKLELEKEGSDRKSHKILKEGRDRFIKKGTAAHWLYPSNIAGTHNQPAVQSHSEVQCDCSSLAVDGATPDIGAWQRKACSDEAKIAVYDGP